MDSILRLNPEHAPWVKYERAEMRKIASGCDYSVKKALKKLGGQA